MSTTVPDVMLRTNGARNIFGDAWTGPAVMPFRVWTEVARFPRTSPDGQDVLVQALAVPSLVYRIRATEDPEIPGGAAFALTTGTGCEQLVVSISKAVAEGLLGLDEETTCGA